MPIRSSRCTDRYIDIFRLRNVGNDFASISSQHFITNDDRILKVLNINIYSCKEWHS